MTRGKRRAITFIVGKIISSKNSSFVYDYSDSKYHNFSGEIATKINVYDYSRSCYLIGNLSSIYDYGTNHYINLKINGNKFSGYDYESGSYYSGTVKNNSISFYDHSNSSYFNYSI